MSLQTDSVTWDWDTGTCRSTRGDKSLDHICYSLSLHGHFPWSTLSWQSRIMTAKNHINIQTKAALWDSLIAIQIHTHDPITRDYTKQLQLHVNIPNWYRLSRRMLYMKDASKNWTLHVQSGLISRSFYRPVYDHLQTKNRRWDHLGTRVFMEYKLASFKTRLFIPYCSFGDQVFHFQLSSCSFGGTPKLQDITGHQWGPQNIPHILHVNNSETTNTNHRGFVVELQVYSWTKKLSDKQVSAPRSVQLGEIRMWGIWKIDHPLLLSKIAF